MKKTGKTIRTKTVAKKLPKIPWKATVTWRDGSIEPMKFDCYDDIMSWMYDHYGEYTGIIAAEVTENKKD